MSLPSRVVVYCGSSTRVSDRYLAIARSVGARFAAEGITLIYGGGRIGLMGAAADACLEAGGQVLGVIPSRLETNEVGHDGLSELIAVDSMHARKQLMVGLADAIVALPGGYGTLDELFEALTWKQLGYHDKPVLLFDPVGYYDSLLAFLEHSVEEAFVRPQHREDLTTTRTIDELITELTSRSSERRRIGASTLR